MNVASQVMPFEAAFLEAMLAVGIGYSVRDNGPIQADGKIQRFRVDGAAKGKTDGWYKVFFDDRPAGVFGCWSKYGDQKFSWTARGLRPLTPEERADLRHRSQEARAKALEEEATRHAEARTRAIASWEGASEAATHPYLARKNVQAYGLRVGPWTKQRRDGSTYTLSPNALLVPMVAKRGEIWSLQAIFPDKVEMPGEKRDKDFVYGGRKQGLYHSIGKPGQIDGRLVIGLCEGYATGASIHEATGLGVMVCFDAGNLLHVAKLFREKLPDARLVIFADNDQFTEIRGVPTNVGILKATDAALTVGGEVIAPWFALEDLEHKPTDWNDLHRLHDLETVKAQIMRKVTPPASSKEAGPDPYAGEVACGTQLTVQEEPPLSKRPECYGMPAVVDQGALELAAMPPEEKPKRARKKDDDDDGRIGDPEAIKKNGWFTILGHDRDAIYVFQHEKGMITRRSEADWPENAFYTLAPKDWWETNFGFKGKFDKPMAVNALIRQAYAMGIYDPNMVRGRGAWRDRGRAVFHLGDRAIVDGRPLDLGEIDSEFIYELGKRLNVLGAEVASDDDGRDLIQAFQLFRWTHPESAILAAGWVALAPLCGALPWRPHIWLSGGTGSGKTALLNLMAHLLAGVALPFQGNSSEAGVRQTLGYDALPVLMDEGEQNTEQEAARMQNLVSLMRQASSESGARTAKGTVAGKAMWFQVRSMFCIASVQVGLKHQADRERICVLKFASKRHDGGSTGAIAERIRFLEGLEAIKSDVDLPSRLFRRALDLLPITLQNIKVFTRAAAERFGTQRTGDQIGTLVAGAWSLSSSRVACIDEARAMIAEYSWAEHTEATEGEECEKALAALLQQFIRNQSQEVTVRELIQVAAGVPCDLNLVDRKAAERLLRNHGLAISWGLSRRVEDAQLLIANGHAQLGALMAKTAYAADLRGQLERLPGAAAAKQTMHFGPEGSKRALGIPLTLVLRGIAHTDAGDHEGDLGPARSCGARESSVAVDDLEVDFGGPN